MTSVAVAAPVLTSRQTYPHWAQDHVRFQDLDRLGHVNNIAFCVYAETGRVKFAEDILPGSTDGSGIGWTIVRLEVDFHGQGHYPAIVDIGTAITRLGTSSVTLVQGLFIGDRCIGTTSSVVVWTDVKAGKAIPLPEVLREGAADFMAR